MRVYLEIGQDEHPRLTVADAVTRMATAAARFGARVTDARIVSPTTLLIDVQGPDGVQLDGGTVAASVRYWFGLRPGRIHVSPHGAAVQPRFRGIGREGPPVCRICQGVDGNHNWQRHP